MTRNPKSPHSIPASPLALNRKQFLRSLSAFTVASLWSTSGFSQESAESEVYNRINRAIRDYDAQGDHRTGSPVDAQSGLWLSDRVDDAGIVPELEWMGVPTVQSHAAFLEVNGQRIDGVPLYDGGVTSPEGITGTFGTQGSSSDIGIAYAGPRIPSAFLDYRRTTEQKAIVRCYVRPLPTV